MATSNSRCASLPMELWQQIAQDLAPLDLLTLSLTTRRFHDAFIDTAYRNCIHFDMHGWKPLWYAVDNGHLAAAERALQQGADPNQQYSWSEDKSSWLTPLMMALRDQDEAMVRLLMRYGADPYAPSGMSTPVNMCVGNGDVAGFRLLLSIESDSDNKRPDDSSSSRRQRLVGGLANLRDPRGYTPLHCAAFYPSQEVILELVKHGAKIDARDTNGLTPLLTAAQDGNPANMQALVSAGANPFLVDYKGRNIVDHAIHICHVPSDRGATLAHATLLLYGNNSMGSWWSMSEAQVHHHLIRTEARQVKALAGWGANIDAKSREGVTPLWVKCGQKVEPELKHRLKMAIEALLEAGADVKFASPNDGMTPLMRAAEAGHEALLSSLRVGGADVMAVNYTGETALGYATRSGSHASVSYLVAWLNDVK